MMQYQPSAAMNALVSALTTWAEPRPVITSSGRGATADQSNPAATASTSVPAATARQTAATRRGWAGAGPGRPGMGPGSGTDGPGSCSGGVILRSSVRDLSLPPAHRGRGSHPGKQGDRQFLATLGCEDAAHSMSATRSQGEIDD